MRTSGSRSLLTAIVALAILATMAEVARAGIVVPNSLETVEGNTNNGLPFSIGTFGLTSQRYQQVYAASEFPGPLLITAILFRPDAFFGDPFTSTLPSIQINLSTTSADPDALSTTFADNVGLDDTIVFGIGPLTLSSSDTGPIGGPKDFDITIFLTTAFSYDPSRGNLLLDVRNFAGGTTTPFDAHDASGDPLSRVLTVSGGVSSPTADFVEGAGLVTMFSTQPVAVPEPATLFLMSSGLASLAGRAWRRRHLRQRPRAAASCRPRREAPTLSENLTLGRPSRRGLSLRPYEFEWLEDWHAPCVVNRQQCPPRDQRGETLKGRSQRCVR
jgi:hypothetical protein